MLGKPAENKENPRWGRTMFPSLRSESAPRSPEAPRIALHWIVALAVAALAALAGCAGRPEPGVPAPPAPGGVHGEIRVPGAEASGPVVVHLDPVEVGLAAGVPSPATIRRGDDGFAPTFLVVAPSQRVRFVDEDGIHHRIFSYSDPNRFDLRLSDGDRAPSVQLEGPGVVRFYCSLHESESGVIFVAASRHFDTAGTSGAYRIGGVPPGRYRLRIWSEALPEQWLDVTVRAGRSTLAHIGFDGTRAEE